MHMAGAVGSGFQLHNVLSNLFALFLRILRLLFRRRCFSGFIKYFFPW